MKILVIDDDPNIIETIALGLQVRWPEAELVSAHLGQQGIDMLEREAPDMVILDVGLPDISGLEVLKRMRDFSNVPVIILSVRGDDESITRGLELGADDYMVKPFRMVELIARMRALMRRRRSA